MKPFATPSPRLLVPLVAAIVLACGGSGADLDSVSELVQAARGGQPTSIVRARVRAAQGGTFSDADGRITIRIPAGALSRDANLRVQLERKAPAAGPDQTVASPAFEVRLQGEDDLALSQPMTLEIAAAPAVHPQLGEIATADGAAWRRLPSSFYRPSTAVAVSTTRALRGTYAAVHRTLRREAGPQVARGYDVFALETFGNESFFGGFLGLHAVLNAVDPVTAVAVGAQVDVTKVPAEIVAVMTGTDLAAKDAALSDPATTRALIKAGAVIGVKGVFGNAAEPDMLTSAGITCALCHETVKPMVFELTSGPTALPIGVPNKDGVPNAAMDAGLILSLTPGAATIPGLPAVLAGWGANQFDVRALNELDDAANNPTDTPPLWNFVDLEAQGYAFGWDGLFQGPNALASQAEAVYDLVMHMNGAFGTPAGNFPPALRPGATVRPEVLAALGASEAAEPGNDLDTQKLLDLQSWMRSLASPAPMAFDEAKAEMGWRIFTGKGSCTTCHQTADLTGPALLDLTGDLTGDLEGGIHVPSLRGVSRSAPYLHDGRLPNLPEAVEAVTGVVAGATGVSFSAEEKAALVEYLKSL